MIFSKYCAWSSVHGSCIKITAYISFSDEERVSTEPPTTTSTEGENRALNKARICPLSAIHWIVLRIGTSRFDPFPWGLLHWQWGCHVTSSANSLRYKLEEHTWPLSKEAIPISAIDLGNVDSLLFQKTRFTQWLLSPAARNASGPFY